VASQLPRDRSTLLVRLMAAGPLLAPAIAELSALPPAAHERAVAEQILVKLQHALGQQPARTPEEQEFIVTMYKTWEEGRAEARAEGLAKGRAEARAADVLTVLRVRGIAVSEAARKRILAQKDLQQLERWLKKASIATSIREVIDDRPAHRPSRSARPAAPRERTRRKSAPVPAHR
jgi:flagellar biosynthesis/type III secretory pathway protein FliH